MNPITKTEFLEKAYALVSRSKDDFVEFSNLGESEVDDLFNIESAIFAGQTYLTNYRIYQFGKRAKEENHTFYITDGGIPAFTTNEEYKRMELTDNPMAESAWPIHPEATENIYG